MMEQEKKKIVETASLDVSQELAVTKVKIDKIHTKKYLDNLKETTYNNKKVVFVLPSGKEY